MLDRELSRHLEEVKDLELKLAHEQREREKAVARATAVQVESGQQLEAKESQCSELKTKLFSVETKLTSAYQEVSTSMIPSVCYMTRSVWIKGCLDNWKTNPEVGIRIVGQFGCLDYKQCSYLLCRPGNETMLFTCWNTSFCAERKKQSPSNL